ncbi:MAG: hypothetical protein ABL307_08575 [Roseitalea porphyridii]|uniref:hypothetical protein n=1 Tax=Roseitalea porphyridii TaxID=1852022 RepID=UPI0032D9918D
MSSAERTEIALEDEAFLPDGETDETETPFAELSRLMVVAIDSGQDDKLVWTAQTGPNGPWSGTWATISDTAYLVMATGVTTDGRVAIAAQTATDPAVHYIDEAPQGPGGAERWNAPVDLGLPEGVDGLVQLVMTRDAGGRIEIFGVDGTDGTVWFIYQNPDRIVDKTEQIIPPGQSEPVTVHVKVPEPPEQPWSAWQALTGDGIGRLTIVNNADGRIMLVATGSNPDATPVYVNQQTQPVALTAAQWSGWTRIDDAASGTAGSQPAAVLDREGAVNIFMVGDLAQVVQIRQDPPGGKQWSAWARPGMTGTVMFNVTAAFDGNGLIVLAGIGEHGELFTNLQVDALRQQWLGWQQVGKVPGFGLLMMDYNADGRLALFQSDSRARSLSFVDQYTVDSTSWNAGFTQLAAEGIVTYGVVRDLTPPGAD